LKGKNPDGRRPRDWSPHPDGAARHPHLNLEFFLNHNRPISSTHSLTRIDTNDRPSAEPKVRAARAIKDGPAVTMKNASVKFQQFPGQGRPNTDELSAAKDHIERRAK